MSADVLDCDCRVMQRQQQHQQQNHQQHSQNVQIQRQQQWRSLQTQPQFQWSATETCTVTTNTSNNSNNSTNSSCNWHANTRIAKQRRKSKTKTTVQQIKNANNSVRTNYCNFNQINRLLIATVGLLITLALTTTTTTTTINTTVPTMLAAVATTTATITTRCGTTTMTTVPVVALLAPISLIGHVTFAIAAAVPPITSPLSLQQQQERQLKHQQLFAMLKNRQGNAGDVDVAAAAGGVDVGDGGDRAPPLAVAGGFVPKHLLDLSDADASLETVGFVADDREQYEKAVKVLAASVNSKAIGNSNNSNGGGRLFSVVASTECPKDCKCLDAYFDCGDKLLDRVPVLPAYVQTLDLVGNKLNNTSVLQIRNLTELIKLTLKRNQLESVPVFSELSALKQLNLANNRIQRISSAALEALPKLKALDLSRNFLHALESSYFPSNNRLAHLILNSNEIASIDEDAFQHLGDLLDLELNNNRLMTLPAGVFRSLPKLRKLSLNNNHLEINWSTFRGLSSIQKLFLKSNNIRALQDGVFYVMHAIETIELDHNGITSLSRQGLFNLTKLHHLSLSNNSISRIEPDTWEFTQSLVSLDLSHNNITEFKPQHLDCLKRLRQLNLGHNKIQYLADNTFDCVKNLEDLNLRRNKLAWIIEDQGATPTFKALRKLKKLDLYGNNLKQITSKSLTGLGTLESLNLGGNALATIQPSAFDHMPHLQKLSFKSLNFICDCGLIWFQRWLRRNEQSTTGTQVQSENAVCGYPEALFDRPLLTVNANDLLCANSPKPTIIQEPPSQLTVNGANITKECIGISPTAASLAAADELKIKWRHDNQNIREHGHFLTAHQSTVGGGVGDSYVTTETRIRQDHATNQTTIIGYLHLYNVSYANAGRYQCVISNAFGTTYSQKFKISIGIHPTFLQIPSNLTIDSGDTARLVCSATGDPVPEIALQKFGGSDFPAATERRLQVVREENAFIITNAKPMDTGIYTCTAESAAGEIKVNATLVVNDKPQPNIPIVRKETVVSDSSVLQCLSDLAADLSQPRREWFKDNKPFHLGTLSADSERYFFTSEHEILVIVNTESADAGRYRCEISDNFKTYTVQTELIVVKEELSQNMIFFGVVIVAALCVLIIALAGFALLLYQRRKAFKRRREACQNANSTSGAPSGLLSGSAGLISGGARVASTSTQLLSGSRGSALDQTQLTTLNRTLLQKPQMGVQRQRPRSLGDFEANASKEDGLHDAGDDDFEDSRPPKHLIITPTPNFQQLLQQHIDSDAEAADNEHSTLTYLKRISLPDSEGAAGEHNQDHLSSKDSGTGSDTAVKRSIDDFAMSALLPTTTTGIQQSADSVSTPINESTPQATRRYNGYRHEGADNSYATDDGGDMDDADLLYAATHALGVSECDVELLDFDRHRAATMRINDKDLHTVAETDPDADADLVANEQTHFLHSNNYTNNDNTSARNNDNSRTRKQHYERLPTTSKLHYPTNYSGNSYDGSGGGGNTPSTVNSNALSDNCKANLSTNSTSGVGHAQTVDI